MIIFWRRIKTASICFDLCNCFQIFIRQLVSQKHEVNFIYASLPTSDIFNSSINKWEFIKMTDLILLNKPFFDWYMNLKSTHHNIIPEESLYKLHIVIVTCERMTDIKHDKIFTCLWIFDVKLNWPIKCSECHLSIFIHLKQGIQTS